MDPLTPCTSPPVSAPPRPCSTAAIVPANIFRTGCALGPWAGIAGAVAGWAPAAGSRVDPAGGLCAQPAVTLTRERATTVATHVHLFIVGLHVLGGYWHSVVRKPRPVRLRPEQA